MVGKPVKTKGNCIVGKRWKPISEFEPNEKELIPKENQFETDAPILGIFIEDSGYKVQVWQWVPGPGDFELSVSTESEVLFHTIRYFFEQNEYFEAFQKYHLKNSGI